MPLIPWQDHHASITPEEYEREVAAMLAALGRDLPGFHVQHQESVTTPDGTFRIDVTARFRQLGVDFLILVECKDHLRPVEREDVQVLADKLRAAGAHKGILFSTNGFQKGAIEYAQSRGIALVRMVEGELMYETRAARPPDAPRPKPPPWANIPKYLGIVTTLNDRGGWVQSTFEVERTEPLVEFLAGSA